MEFGRNQMIAAGVVVALVLVGLFATFGMGGGADSRRDEVPLNVEAIRQAQIQYHDAFSKYVSAESAPREPHAVNGEAVKWEPTAGFRKISWAPETGEEVYGAYSVTATADGFKVTGACDVDGDGNRAIFEATLEEAVKMVSDEGVY